ncbi:MAG: efflux RND transporter permease subunit, partial [Flavobacteriales bacterium]|nr:efflux RND transporter permease subunit [Flavobacteriales bacterium]
ALGLGAAAKSRIPMGIVIIGGLMFSLVLTLYVVPALYSVMSREKRAGGDKEKKRGSERPREDGGTDQTLLHA